MSALAKTIDITIPNGAAVPVAGAPLGNGILIGILIPASWTAANLTFKASIDDSSFFDVYDAAGTELTVTVGGSSRYIALDQALFVGFSSIIVRSGTTGSPVNQSGAKILKLVTKEF